MASVASNATALALSVSQSNARLMRNRLWQGMVATRSTMLSLLTGVIMWELAGRSFQYNFLPPFSNVLRSSVDLIASGQILGYLGASLTGLVIGYGLAAVSGVALGLMMGRYRKVEFAFDLYLSAFLAAPKIVFVPVLFALFGVNRNVQIAVVFLSAFFIIVMNTSSALRTVDANFVEMARSFGARERQLFWKVLLPGAMPLTMAGLRLGMGRAVKGMINGEMFIALFGLGGLLRTYGSRFDSEKVFAILLIVICVALVFSSLVQAAERRFTHWTESHP